MTKKRYIELARIFKEASKATFMADSSQEAFEYVMNFQKHLADFFAREYPNFDNAILDARAKEQSPAKE